MMQTAERVKLIRRMTDCGLELEHTGTSPFQLLSATCDRAEAEPQFAAACQKAQGRLQRELIQNPDFYSYYRYFSEAEVSNSTILEWLERADSAKELLTNAGTAAEFTALAASGIISAAAQYDCLKYFREDIPDRGRLAILAKNLNAYRKYTPDEFSPVERELLRQPYLSEYIRQDKDDLHEKLQLLSENPALQSVLAYLYAENVELELERIDLKRLTWLQHEDAELFALVFTALGDNAEDMSEFIFQWRQNQSVRYDLEWFALREEPLSEQERHDTLSTRLGYLSTLYSGKLNIPFGRVKDFQIDVLVYAIAQKKQKFLAMVTDNFEVFSSLSIASLLFQESFYRRCNLNTLTVRNLQDSEGKYRKRNHLEHLCDGTYTFAELKLIRYAPPVYYKLFNRLLDLSVDRRMVVMRELLKKDILPGDTTEQQLNQLAACFMRQPLHRWREKELCHIQGLSTADALRVLQVYDKIGRMVPEFKTWQEAVFAARNAERLEPFASFQEVRGKLLDLDQDWGQLSEAMGFSDEFIAENQQNILSFLVNEGAEMSRLFYEYTDMEDAFRRIVQAELMGKFYKLKYYPDDLKKEISFPLTGKQQQLWQENTSKEDYGLRAAEVDDFYSTLRLGELPHRTCLSYHDGGHMDCLLAGFDSNKKILLAWRGGEVVGRAVIRLTKGTFYRSDGKSGARTSLEFADLTDETAPKNAPPAEEHLTLFLERLYTSHLSDGEVAEVKAMFVRLVREKAIQMNALSVLASEYRAAYAEGQYAMMGYFLYISKSKSGAQYLDSLSGEARISKEGSYGSGSFLVAQSTGTEAVA